MNRDRCHIVVFNCDRVRLLLESFSRIRGFDPAKDRLIVFDCSAHPQSERRALEAFAHARGWRMGREVQFVRRGNWGLDQGGRVDYFGQLASASRVPVFIWQFQEHFLDAVSPASRYPHGVVDVDGTDIGGHIKGDVIADGADIDLDANEAVLQSRPSVGVLHAGRGGVALFTESSGAQWLYSEGGNFCARPELLRRVFNPEILGGWRAICDQWPWPLFMEFEWGRLLSNTGCDWYDVGTGIVVNPVTVTEALDQPGAVNVTLREYAASYGIYRPRLDRVMSLPRWTRESLGWSRRRYWIARKATGTLVRSWRTSRSSASAEI